MAPPLCSIIDNQSDRNIPIFAGEDDLLNRVPSGGQQHPPYLCASRCQSDTSLPRISRVCQIMLGLGFFSLLERTHKYQNSTLPILLNKSSYSHFERDALHHPFFTLPSQSGFFKVRIGKICFLRHSQNSSPPSSMYIRYSIRKLCFAFSKHCFHCLVQLLRFNLHSNACKEQNINHIFCAAGFNRSVMDNRMQLFSKVL